MAKDRKSEKTAGLIRILHVCVILYELWDCISKIGFCLAISTNPHLAEGGHNKGKVQERTTSIKEPKVKE